MRLGSEIAPQGELLAIGRFWPLGMTDPRVLTLPPHGVSSSSQDEIALSAAETIHGSLL